MSNSLSIVVTSINPGTPAMARLDQECARRGIDFIVIGDVATPEPSFGPGTQYFDIDAQRSLGSRTGQICPIRSYARKNIGYLVAIRGGAGCIIETDDDNFPEPAFFVPDERLVRAPVLDVPGWTNIYQYFTDERIWPRGLPLEHLGDRATPYDDLVERKIFCPIQQGLADHDPDIDAVCRMTVAPSVEFRRDRRVIVTGPAWCPFNSQNTTWWAEAFPLMYLPAHCPMRMSDIWRGLVAVRILRENGWGLLFREPTVRQDRNQHDLLQDFADEVPGYLNNARIANALDELSLTPGRPHLADNMRRCYGELVAIELVGDGELGLLDAWLDDLGDLGAIGG